MQETHRREAADLNLREAFTDELALEAKARDAEDVALGAQAAAAEYGQSIFGDDWLPIGDHGGSCKNGYWHRNRSPWGYGFRPHLDAAGEAFGLGFGPDWGRFWTPRRGRRD